MTLIIAGYTAAPANKEDSMIYYKHLATVKRAGGLELAWKGAQMKSDIEDLMKIVPDEWVFTINAIPATFGAWASDHRFGLASPDAAGRETAVAMITDIAAAVRAVNDAAGRKAVLAVEIQPAPGFSDRIYTAHADSFARSLDAVAGLDWDGCAVTVEHCDAYVEGQTPQKGFLTLDQELNVLNGLTGSPVGMSINWGRSLIEVRDPARVVDHVKKASASGLLKGFTLSGTAAKDNAVGKAWADSHLAFADTTAREYAEPASLMTVALAEESLRHVCDLVFLAVKTNWPASRPDPKERAASVIANFETALELIDRNPTSIMAASAA
ncbi:DUF4862 family protein [Caballeronia sp. dw_19]|uniref:DUF4862 family protein n=1 Tax=Caballeronia sp. dw_19 TaxID=2719791 RepID=UPI001BD59F9B|nr:DUF4862 family protein [Caballeronia sp. dw_19]